MRDNLDEEEVRDIIWSSPSAFHNSLSVNTGCGEVDAFGDTVDDTELFEFLKSKGDIVVSCDGERTLPFVLEMLNKDCVVMNGEYIDD